MSTETQFDQEAFQRDALAQRQARREALTEALRDLETAAWTRSWGRLKTARVRIEALTGIAITGPLRAELQKAVKDGDGQVRI